MKIKAAVLERIGALTIREVESESLLPGQVLVKVLYSGICRSQLMEVRGMRGEDRWIPHLLGHEGAGTVIAIGQNVSKVDIGDDIILTWIRADGLEAPGATYSSSIGRLNSGPVTTFSNYTVVSENRLIKKPSGLPFDEAVLYGCALLTGGGLVINEIPTDRDTCILVLGLGGVGLSALLTLIALGYKNVIAADSSRSKINFAEKLPIICTLDPTDTKFEGQIRGIAPDGVDVCIEAVGRTDTIELGFRLVKKGGGKLVFASHPPSGDLIRIDPYDLISGKSIYGTWGGASHPDAVVPFLVELLDPWREYSKTLIAKQYCLEEINIALDDLEAARTFRPLIAMDH